MEQQPNLGTSSYWQLDEIVARLRSARRSWRLAHPRNREHGSASFPSRATLEEVMAILRGVLFPLRLGPSYVRAENEDAYVAETLENGLNHLYGQIRRELAYSSGSGSEQIDAEGRRIIGSFAHALPDLRELLDRDVEAAFVSDPAARSVDEVLLCYPSILAIIHHRVANCLHRLGAPMVARIISELAHSVTGIDIHPGAEIGASFFIDHGTGVVIGETAVIGENVRLHQAVTLGGPAGAIEEGRGRPRHPIIEDEVVIYAGATLLGRITIGRGSIIGGNVWLTEDVTAGSYVEQPRPTGVSVNSARRAENGDIDLAARQRAS